MKVVGPLYDGFDPRYWSLIIAVKNLLYIQTYLLKTFFVYPLSLAKELKQLRYAYILSFFFVVIMTLAVFYECFVFNDLEENLRNVKLFRFEGISSTFCTAVFAYSCHPNCLDVFKVWFPLDYFLTM